MQDREWDDLTQHYLFRKNYGRSTRDTYALGIRTFRAWSELESLDIETISPTAFVRYKEYLINRGLATSTVAIRLKNIRLFLDYLVETGRLPTNPATGLSFSEPEARPRNLLTLSEVVRIWNHSRGRERRIAGLLMLCGLRRDEVRDARAEDLFERDGTTFLKLRRSGEADINSVAVPEILARELKAELSGRRAGLLFIARTGKGKIATTYIHKLVQRVALTAGVTMPVTSLSFSQALRSIAIEHRFTYVGVLRSVSHGNKMAVNELLRMADVPPSEHASIRLGRMIEVASSPPEARVFQAEALIAGEKFDPCLPVMMAGATLESELRDACVAIGVDIRKKDPSLSTYATALRAAGYFSIAQLRTIERIYGFRNLASHGWFDELTRDDARWVVRETRSLITIARATES